MKLFGQLSEVVRVVFRLSGGKEVKLEAGAQTGTSTDRTFQLPPVNTNATYTGELVEKDLAQTLTNKTIDGDNNTIQDVAVSSLKTILADADKALIRDAAGAVTSAKIVNANVDPAAAIAYSKLNLASSIVNADIATGAAVAYSKLALSNSIVNADIASAAAIADSKLATISTAGKVSGAAISSGSTISSVSLDSSNVTALQNLTYGVTTTSLASNTFAAGVPFVRVIGGSTLETITSPSSGKFLILVNESADVTIRNDFGSGSNSIYTGTGTDYTLKSNSAVSLIYDSGISRWVLTGGAGAGSGGGTTLQVVASTATLSVGDVMYLNGSTFTKAQADAAPTAEVVGVVSKIVDAGNYELTLAGAVTKAAWGLTPGGVYFLSSSTAGGITLSEPSTIGHVSAPIGVAQSATVLLVAPKRGVVVGGTNARTQLNLTANSSTQIFNAATPTVYPAGELTGWVELGTTAKFYFKAPFARNAGGTDWNISPSYVGDTPPAGFSITMSSAGVITATCPTFIGTGLINYALNAPAVGATFPLAVDASSLTTGTVPVARLPTATSTTAGTIPYYTEGTFTPVLKFGGATTGITYSANRYGNYTRIGNRCYFNLYFALSSKGTATGVASIDGLPFTVATSANGGFTAVAIWTNNVSVNGGVISGYCDAGFTTMSLNSTPTTGNALGANSLSDVNWATNGSIMISGHYSIG